MTALDPRSPLVVDTRELGRRPGASHRTSRTVPAPADLGSEVIGVAAGSQLAFELLLEAVMEGVLVSGTVAGTATGECVRCLAGVSAPFVVRLQELYAYDRRTAADDGLLALDGDLLDLDPALRDAVVPTLPFQPVCRDDCAGLPTRYGPDDEAPEDAGDQSAGGGAPTAGDDVDPRWAALLAFSAPGRTTPHDHQPGQRRTRGPGTSTPNREG